MSVAPVAPTAAALPAQAVAAAGDTAPAAADAAPATAAVATGSAASGQTAPSPQPAALLAVDVARAAAAGLQGGLAPLLADLAQAATSPALPAEAKAAITQILALQIPTDSPVTAQVLKAAVAQSGLFLEAHLAQATSTGQAPPTDLKAALLVLQRALAAVPTSPSPVRAPVANLATQGQGPAATPSPQATPAASGSSPAPAGASPAPQSPAATTLTQEPATPAGQVVAQAAEEAVSTTNQSVDATPQAILASGAKTANPANDLSPHAAASNPTPAETPTISVTPSSVPFGSTKTPIVQPLTNPATTLQAAPTGPIAAQLAQTGVASAAVPPEADLTPLAPPAEEPLPDLRTALLALQRAAASVPGAHIPVVTPRSVVPPPPLRQSATSAQPAEPGALPSGDEDAIVQHLASETNQALARVTLHQLASLPDQAASGGPAWIFELPFATPQGGAVAQFVIDQDDEAATTSGSAQAWRTRFSIDVEPLGPVHVHLRVSQDGGAAVTMWAERQTGVERLRGQGPALAEALSADVVIHPGAPRRSAPLPGPGQFVDQSS